MRMLLLSLALLAPAVLVGGEQQADSRPPAVASAAGETAVLACSAVPAAAAAEGSCAGCADRCSSQRRACEDGSIKSCYLAAACLCKCNLDEGGCGSSTQVLRECVEENERRAREISD